ncbi:MAG: aldose 1-epimerase [Paracoccaceae bacterium]
MSDNRQITRHVLADGDVSVAILSLGCITQDWQVPLDGRRVPVVLGYRHPQDYLNNPHYLGIIAGRVANRISGAGFTFDGQRYVLPVNDRPNHLHGGPAGIYTQNWGVEPDGAGAVRLHLESPSGDQGYPGWVSFEVTISLQGHTLTYDMRADTDCPTPVNLAQHSYYNLMGGGAVLDHQLKILGDHFTPTDAAMVPTGKVQSLTGQDFDLRQAKTVHRADPCHHGLDMNYVLSGAPSDTGVMLTAPNGLQLTMMTDQPCLQLYTGGALAPAGTPLAGQFHAPFAGLCLEPQQYPNALNTSGFPSIVISPDQPYRQKLQVRIAPDGAP